jgi:hypothetical protein
MFQSNLSFFNINKNLLENTYFHIKTTIAKILQKMFICDDR